MKKLLLAFSMVAALNCSAQIVYTDIADMVLYASPSPGTDYDLDIDDDASPDFKVNMIGDVATAGYGNFISGAFSTMNGALQEAVWGDAMHLIAGDSIGASSLTWMNFSTDLPVTLFVGGASYGQEWLVPVTDGYFGFKFEILGNLHYGWMRMDVSSTSVEMTIKDWAYNAIPDEPIAAGQTTSLTGVTAFNTETILCYPNPSTTGVFNLRSGTASWEGIEVTDIHGQVILKKSMWEEHNLQLNLSDQPSGLYFITAYFQGSISIHKLITL